MLSGVAEGDIPEARLEEVEAQLRAAASTRKRRKQMIELAQLAQAETGIPGVDEGRRFPDDFCTASAHDLVARGRKRDFAAARKLLIEVFGHLGFAGGADWELFLGEFLEEPSDEELDAARNGVARLVKPLEDAAQREAEL